MYHPSRGGVRGGADQFSWENVKTDKHRENYLGHSIKAPVGRWQKGKDLTWYHKERNQGTKTDTKSSELAAVKKAEEEAMLIALGHKSAKRETQPLTKEEMAEALKRGQCDRDDLNVERIEGVGIASGRTSLITKGVGVKTEGVDFEGPPPSRESKDETKHQSGLPSDYKSKIPDDQSYPKSKKSKEHKKSSKKKHKKKHRKKHKKRKSSPEESTDEEDLGSLSKTEGHSHSDERRERLRAVNERREPHSKRPRHDSSSDVSSSSDKPAKRSQRNSERSQLHLSNKKQRHDSNESDSN